jgi:thymidylate kinase
MKRPKRIAVIGIDGSGKDRFAKKLLEKEKDAGIIKVAKYDKSNKVFSALGKMPLKMIRSGEEKNSKKMVLAGYFGLAALSPFYRIRKEKGKKKMIFVRYPAFDIEALSKVYGSEKANRILKRLAKFISASPKVDELYMLEIDPKIAMKNIRERGEKIQSHETEEKLRVMAKEYSRLIKEAKKSGVRVHRVDAAKLIR